MAETDKDLELLITDATRAALTGGRLALIGLTDWTLGLVKAFRERGLLHTIEGLYVDGDFGVDGIATSPLSGLSSSKSTHLVVCDNRGKEALLYLAQAHLRHIPIVVLSGYDHFRFEDSLFHSLSQTLSVPSLANGYPNTLIHIYQCLKNAASLRLDGIVVEFGMFKGGTTMFISRVVEALGMNWPVYGLDTFDGFPPRRSLFDMYDHPGCIIRGSEFARAHLASRNVHIIEGDIVETCQQIAHMPIVLAFMDTDNYTPCAAALQAIKGNLVKGGCIVFDHFTGVDRFRYTLGERLAAIESLNDGSFFNLHDTGVFIKQL